MVGKFATLSLSNKTHEIGRCSKIVVPAAGEKEIISFLKLSTNSKIRGQDLNLTGAQPQKRGGARAPLAPPLATPLMRAMPIRR